MTTVFLLLLLFQVKHFLCDYPLQRPWMLGKFLPGWRWVLPLAAHAAVHGAFTLGIALAFGSHWAWALALFDASVHFAMDRVKASPNLMGRWKPLTSVNYAWTVKNAREGDADCKRAVRGNRLFWDSIGLDQMVHHLTHYAVIWFLVR